MAQRAGAPKLSFEITPDPGSLARAFFTAADMLSQVLERDVPSQFADEIIELMRTRTRSGHRSAEGRTGGTFEPYSEKYAAFKGVARNAVDLTLGESMLDSMFPTIEPDAIIIGFEGKHTEADVDNEVVAFWHQHGVKKTNLPARPFFGLTEEEEDFVVMAMQRIVETVTAPRMQTQIDGAR